MNWFQEYVLVAAKTDQLAASPEHAQLLAMGLAGEAGSILSELKKLRREQRLFAARRAHICEEMGDYLWYFVRLAQTHVPEVLADAPSPSALRGNHVQPSLDPFLRLGSATAGVLTAVSTSDAVPDLKSSLRRAWESLVQVSVETGISLQEVAERNRSKILGRWPVHRTYVPLFDTEFQGDEQLPRAVSIDFIDSIKNGHPTVSLRCNDIALGDRLTDNIREQDGYRFHDVFHVSHMVHLGWSPIMRGLFRCKRKSDPRVDEAEDGARAAIIEEAITAIIFSRAKELQFFEATGRVDYDLLKTVQGLIAGYEVEAVPLWQWEIAILDGYRVFRALRNGAGGRVAVDLRARSMTYSRPAILQRARA